MKIGKFRLAGLALCCAIAAVSIAPQMLAQDSSAQTGLQQPPPQPDHGQGRGEGMGMGMGGFMGMSPTMGTVTAIAGSEITMKNEQGEAYKVATSANTHFRKDRDEAKISDIHVGDVIVAAGNLDDSTKTVGAVFVSVLDPQQAARLQQMRDTFGKTWTAGKVTAIKDLTLTVERPDKTTQTITVDENTTFRKGMRNNAEEITFPDIKVGDMVRATGAVQNGSFAATNLAVMEPGAGRGQGRFGQNGQGPQGSSGQSPASQERVQPSPQPEGTPSGTTPAQPPNAPQN
jgi:hypothetical protein